MSPSGLEPSIQFTLPNKPVIASTDITSLLQKILGRFGYSIKRRRPGIRRGNSSSEIIVTVAGLMEAVHGDDIYKDFNYQEYPEDLAGWGGNSLPSMSRLR